MELPKSSNKSSMKISQKEQQCIWPLKSLMGNMGNKWIIGHVASFCISCCVEDLHSMERIFRRYWWASKRAYSPLIVNPSLKSQIKSKILFLSCWLRIRLKGILHWRHMNIHGLKRNSVNPLKMQTFQKMYLMDSKK